MPCGSESATAPCIHRGVVAFSSAVVLNAAGWWGDVVALTVDDGLQLSAGAAAAACGLFAALRVEGAQRRWRLLIAVGMVGWSVGQAIWSWYQSFGGRE